jgi:hypothetical protein
MHDAHLLHVATATMEGYDKLHPPHVHCMLTDTGSDKHAVGAKAPHEAGTRTYAPGCSGADWPRLRVGPCQHSAAWQTLAPGGAAQDTAQAPKQEGTSTQRPKAKQQYPRVNSLKQVYSIDVPIRAVGRLENLPARQAQREVRAVLL